MSRANDDALYTEIFIMNTLSINKIIEFYIHRVTVVYCLITFIVHFYEKMMYRIVLCSIEFDYNIHRRVKSHFSEEKSREILKIKTIWHCFSVPNLYANNKTKL